MSILQNHGLGVLVFLVLGLFVSGLRFESRNRFVSFVCKYSFLDWTGHVVLHLIGIVAHNYNGEARPARVVHSLRQEF
jgi:hypothetical protein